MPGLRIAPGADSVAIAAALDAIEGRVRLSGVSDDVLDRVVLVAGEVLANVAEHGEQPVVVHWHGDTAGGCLSVVGDAGPGSDRIASAELPPADSFGGRGLFLIRALSERVVTEGDRLDLHFASREDVD